MEESTNTTQTPKSNAFVVPDDKAYAWTDFDIWEVAEHLLTRLEPVDLEDLDPHDHECSICQDELLVSENVRPSHDPVKIGCGHIFGRKCIIRWFNPLCSFKFFNEHLDANQDDPLLGNPGCPMCRRFCFPEVEVEPAELLACRLSFWDMAYASAGVARSEKEERSREDLQKYVEYCRLIHDDRSGEQWELDLLHKNAQLYLFNFAVFLKSQMLTPEQENLRRKLERIARKDLKKCPFEDGTYVFDIESDDNERAVFANEPMLE